MVTGYQSSALPRSRQSWAQRRLRVPPAKERAAGSSSAGTSQTPTSNLLNWLAAPPPLKAFLLAERAQAGAQAAKSAALSISERGFCVCRGGLDDQIVANARCEIDALFRRGAMRPGGFTVAGRDDVVKKDRDDHTLWLNEYLHAVGGPQKGGAETVTALDGLISLWRGRRCGAVRARPSHRAYVARRRRRPLALHRPHRLDVGVLPGWRRRLRPAH